MKSKLSKELTKMPITTYPCLGVSRASGMVVLFTSHGTGCVVSEGEGTSVVGDSRSGLEMSMFSLYDGAVTLSN